MTLTDQVGGQRLRDLMEMESHVNDASWMALDSGSGQVCIRLSLIPSSARPSFQALTFLSPCWVPVVVWCI